MNRARWIAAAIAVVPVSCADESPPQVSSVAVAATPCDRPTARLGVGTVVAEGLVLTAAHIVEDELRSLEVDGQPARVVAIDTRIDVAVLSVDAALDEDTVERGVARLADAGIADTVRITTPAGVIDTTVERIVTLDVEDTTDEAVRRRLALVLDGAVPAGTSGAPVVDDGHLVGVVTISHAERDVTYATAAAEIRTLLGSVVVSQQAVTQSSLAAPGACA